MITSRDREILNYLSKYKFATISQLEKIFFKDQQYSYNICVRRLNRMKEANYLKIHRDVVTNKNIYIYLDDEKKLNPPSQHRILILDVLAELEYNGFTVENFEIEKEWLEGKVKSDGFVIFRIGNRRYYYFIEVQLSNHHHNLEKYDMLYESMEVQQYIGKNIFPRIMFISDRHYSDMEIKNTDVVTLNTKLDTFASILLD